MKKYVELMRKASRDLSSLVVTPERLQLAKMLAGAADELEQKHAEPVTWPLASPEDAGKDWTLDYRFIEQVERAARQRTDFTTSMEATEQVLIAAAEVLGASQPAEPVGYVRPYQLEALRSGKACAITMKDKPAAHNRVTIPLYAAPQPAEPVQSESIVTDDMCELLNERDTLRAEIECLRAELAATRAGWRIGIFFVRLVRKGDTYGRDDCLTHDEDEPLVEFYDSRYPHTPRGQFISSYYLSVFMGASDGIDLYGGEPEWKATAEEVKQLQQWILYEEHKTLQAERIYWEARDDVTEE